MVAELKVAQTVMDVPSVGEPKTAFEAVARTVNVEVAAFQAPNLTR